MDSRKYYYLLKPVIPRPVQIMVRRKRIQVQRQAVSNIWPIDPQSHRPPANWQGWPGQKQFAVVLTHDVEWGGGQEKCLDLMRHEQQLGFVSSFNFVPERYQVSAQVRKTLVENGFEVGVHGLKHDGKLYSSKAEFMRRAAKINTYIEEWNAVGFRSPAMHHNLDWLHALNVTYDASTFDTDPFEPQADGVGTIFPFWVANPDGAGGYVELPYTLAQDFTLFVLMQERGFEVWRHKLDWIAEQGGMVLINVHPDYLAFNGQQLGLETFPVSYYLDLLEYIRTAYRGAYWHALPREMANFVKNPLSMTGTEAFNQNLNGKHIPERFESTP